MSSFSYLYSLPIAFNELVKSINFNIIILKNLKSSFGNEDIDLAFDRLKRELMALARLGRCNLDVLEDGEYIISTLIRGLRMEEQDAKAGINPVEAGNEPEFVKIITSIFVNGKYNGPDDINNIDACQALSLFMYQTYKYSIGALEKILVAVRDINQVLRDRPDQSSSLPSH